MRFITKWRWIWLRVRESFVDDVTLTLAIFSARLSESDRQMNAQAENPTNRQATNRQTYADKTSHRQTNIHADPQTYKQTDITNTQTATDTHKQPYITDDLITQ